MPKATRVHTTPPKNTSANSGGCRAADHPAGAKAEKYIGLTVDNVMRLLEQVNVCTMHEGDEYFLFSVRVPPDACGPDPDFLGLTDEKFCADLAASIAARIRRPRPGAAQPSSD
jgi:hypothetical protein